MKRIDEETLDKIVNGVIACMFAFALQVTTGNGAGLLLCATLGWHWSPIGTPLGKLRVALLSAVGGLTVGCLVGIPQVFRMLDLDSPFFLVLGVVTTALAGIGWLLLSMDRKQDRSGVFSKLWWRPVTYVLFSTSLAFATSFVLYCFEGNPTWTLVTVVMVFFGGGWSAIDQFQSRSRLSYLETYAVALLFGGFVAPLLADWLDDDPIERLVTALGVAIGAGLWFWDSHQRGRPFSVVKGTLNGFVGGVLLRFIHGMMEMGPADVPWLLIGAIPGCLLSVVLGYALARHRGRRILWTPLLLSPVTGTATGTIIAYLCFFAFR